MTYDFYLQGSYRNDTNIRGDSDVDVVLEMTSSFHHDASAISQYEQRLLASSFQPASYDWNDFRRETLKALEGGVASRMVGQGNKSIKLKADPPRLAADVVVCMGYRRYIGYTSYVEGITFLALRDNRWIVQLSERALQERCSQECTHLGSVQADGEDVQECPQSLGVHWQDWRRSCSILLR